MSEDRFRQNLDAVTRALGERAAEHPDPVAEAMARRVKVQADLEARDQRRRLMLGGTAAALGSVAVTLGILYFAWPPERRPAIVTQAVAETRPVAEEPKTVAAATPEPAPVSPVSAAPAPQALAPEPSQQVGAVEPQPATQVAPQAALLSNPQPEPQRAPQPARLPPSLARDEVREMQKRLLDFGFDPGPVDGNAGRLTQAALARYQQQRGQPQSSTPDRDALEQLRQDPTPKAKPPRQVAQRPAWRSGSRNDPPPPSPPPSSSAPPQRSGGNSALEFLRSADASLSRWLNGLSH